MSTAARLGPLLLPPWTTLDPVPFLRDPSTNLGIPADPGVSRIWAGQLPLAGDEADLPVAWLRRSLDRYLTGGVGIARHQPLIPGDIYEPPQCRVVAGNPIRAPRCVVSTLGVGRLSDVLGDSSFVADLDRGGVCWFEANRLDANEVHLGLPAHGLDVSLLIGGTPPPNTAHYGVATSDPAKYVGGEVLVVFYGGPLGNILFRPADVQNPTDAQALAIFQFFATQLNLCADSFAKLGRFNAQETPTGGGAATILARFNALCDTLGDFGGRSVGSPAVLTSAIKARVRDFFNL